MDTITMYTAAGATHYIMVFAFKKILFLRCTNYIVRILLTCK